MAVDDLSDGVGGQVGSLGDLDIRNAVVVALFPQRVDDMYLQLIHCGLFFDWGGPESQQGLVFVPLDAKDSLLARW